MALLNCARTAPALVALVALAGCSVERGVGRFPNQDPGDFGPPPPDFGTEPDAGDGGPSTAPLSDPEGQWMLFVEDRNCLVGAGDPVESIIWTWYLVDIERPAAGRASLTLSTHICRQQLSPLAFGFLSIVPDIVADTGETRQTGAFLVGEAPGSAFFADTIVDYWGVEGVADDEPVPADLEDPRLVDQDGDGHPGVTFPVTSSNGTVELCQVYVTQRIRAALEGQIVSARRIEGVALTGTDKSILGTSTELCASGDVVPNGAGNRFALVRIDGVSGAPDADTGGDGAVDCDELRGGLEALMGAYALERSAPDADLHCGD